MGVISDIQIKQARSAFHNKKDNPDFVYFAEKGVEYFTKWYVQLERKCCYCGTEEYKIKFLFDSGRLSTKRKRGKSLELERFDSNTNLYTENNCGLACYFCNNHKSDIITPQEHKQYFSESIARYISELYYRELETKQVK